jgi:hypothetical protein
MTTQNKNQIKKVGRKVADNLHIAINKVSKPPQDANSEAAQEAHEAALASHRTKRKGGMILSLNSHPDKKGED